MDGMVRIQECILEPMAILPILGMERWFTLRVGPSISEMIHFHQIRMSNIAGMHRGRVLLATAITTTAKF